MIDMRRKNANWAIAVEDGSVPSWERVGIAVLMDLRDELQEIKRELHTLNGLLHCPNFQAIPSKLDRISRNTLKPRKAAKK